MSPYVLDGSLFSPYAIRKVSKLSEHELLIDRRKDGEVRIIINRPSRHNALSGGVLGEIARAVTEAGSDPANRLVLLSGAGEKYFAAGGDLRELDSVRSERQVLVMTDESRVALDAIRACAVPVIACLNGDAIGGGAELALACDMRLIASSARIGFIQGRLAITSAWGGGVDLLRLVGPSRAMRMMTRCELVPADVALQWGLAEGIFADGFEGADVEAFVGPMLRLAPQVIRGIKALARASRSGRSYREMLEIEQSHLVETWLHQDHWDAAERIFVKRS